MLKMKPSEGQESKMTMDVDVGGVLFKGARDRLLECKESQKQEKRKTETNRQWKVQERQA
jgi:hypothetical protein